MPSYLSFLGDILLENMFTILFWGIGGGRVTKLLRMVKNHFQWRCWRLQTTHNTDNHCQLSMALAEGRRGENDLRSREIGMEVDDLHFSTARASSLAANLWTSTFQAAPTKLNPSAWPHRIPTAAWPTLRSLPQIAFRRKYVEISSRFHILFGDVFGL